MKITKEQLKHIYKVLEKEEISYLQQTISEWYPKLFKETGLEVGKWYKYPDFENWKIFITDNTKGKEKGVGVNCSGNWMQDWLTTGGCELDKLIPCLDEEVKKALTKEIKKRGLWDTPIKCLFSKENWNNDKDFGRCFNGDKMWTRHGVVFKDGVFADKLETITKEEAEKQLGKIIN